MLVIIIFAVTLLLGTGLMAAVTQSHKIAIEEANNQQAYYAAKAVLDTFKEKIETSSSQQQKQILEGIIVGETTNAKKSNEIQIRDTKGQIWSCYLTVELNMSKSSGNIKHYDLIATAQSSSDSNVKAQVKGVIKTDESKLSGVGDVAAAIDSWWNLDMKSEESIHLSEAYSRQAVNLDTKKVITADTIHAFTTLKIGNDINYVPQSITVDNLYATNGITIKAKGDISAEQVISSNEYDIVMTSETGIVKANRISGKTLTLTVPADKKEGVKTSLKDKIYTKEGKYTINGEVVTEGCRKTTEDTGTPTVDSLLTLPTKEALYQSMFNQLSVEMRNQAETVNITGSTFTQIMISRCNGEINGMVACPDKTSGCLVMKNNGTVVKHMKKDKAYIIQSNAATTMQFGESGVGIDGRFGTPTAEIQTFYLYIDPNHAPSHMKFIENHHISYGGYYKSSGTYVTVDKAGEKLQFGRSGTDGGDKFAVFDQYQN